MDFDRLIAVAQKYVDRLLNEKLAKHLYFHNAVHTSYVVLAAREIGRKSDLLIHELAIVIIAALFHDTGYTRTYKGHELVSVEIATSFLKDEGVEKWMIDNVADCILATRFPQHPVNLMQQVICDADFYHFSVDHYSHFARVLKLEWEAEFGFQYTTQQWNAINLETLRSHTYFTDYGKLVLQLRKQQNIIDLEKQV